MVCFCYYLWIIFFLLILIHQCVCLKFSVSHYFSWSIKVHSGKLNFSFSFVLFLTIPPSLVVLLLIVLNYIWISFLSFLCILSNMNVHCTKMVNLSTFMCIKCNELQLHPFLKLYLFFMHYELNFFCVHLLFFHEHFERNKTKKRINARQ
jgi:hypothetical protein